MIITLDTQATLWGLLEGGDKNDGDKRHRSRVLFAELDATNPKPTIILSAVVVTELLTRKHPDQRDDLLTVLSKNFEIAPFDVRSAGLAARLYDEHSGLVQKHTPYDKRNFRADTMIIASACTAGATVIYSDDARCRKIAVSVMEARKLPTHSENLFVDHTASGGSTDLA